MGDGCLIKTNVNLREFEKCAADRLPLGTIAKENGATITRMGMDGKMQTIDANPGDKVYKGDIIKTPPDGSVAIALRDKTILSGGPSNTIDMNQWNVGAEIEDAAVKRGSISVISGKIAKATTEPVSFASPGMAIGVRG